MNWKRDEESEKWFRGEFYKKMSPPMISMIVYNRHSEGWEWKIEMQEVRRSTIYFKTKELAMENCQQEAEALLNTALQEIR